MNDPVEEMLAKQACAELVYKLARGLDRCDRDLLLSVFQTDATDDHGGFKGAAVDFVDWALGALAEMERTQHLIGNVLIEVNVDAAVGESYFVANHDMLDATGKPVRMIVAGRYLDRFRRHAGVWKIAHRHAIYDWNASLDRTDGWDRSPTSVRVFGQRGADDASYAHAAALRRAEMKESA